MSSYNMSNSQLNKLYSAPHYYYQVICDDKEVFGSVDKKTAEKKYNETNGEYVELVQLNHGNFHKILKSKEN